MLWLSKRALRYIEPLSLIARSWLPQWQVQVLLLGITRPRADRAACHLMRPSPLRACAKDSPRLAGVSAGCRGRATVDEHFAIFSTMRYNTTWG